MTRQYTSGDVAYVNGTKVVVVRRVLHNQPAYRVRTLRAPTRGPCEEWVVDGVYLSDDPKRRVGLVAVQPRRSVRRRSAAQLSHA